MHISRLDGHSLDPQAPVLARLMADMPELFSEGKLDPQKLKSALGADAFAGQERYGLTWNGKSECFKKIQETTTKTLRPCREESVDFDTTENLFIEGDNLQVLKVLQRSYYGRVKMIYIDPPYNTGNDFIYSDKFTRTRKEELVANGSMDEQGNIINHDFYRQNTRDSGHFHSNWLNMMYPRLFVAKSLLRPDGVIFVSIDDNEAKNLRAMMDEIFGEENFIESFVWRSRLGKGSTSTETATIHEYIVCYAKNIAGIDFLADIRVKTTGSKERLRQWGQGDRREDRPSMYFPIVHEEFGEVYPTRRDGSDGRWRASQPKVAEMLKSNQLIFERQDDGRVEVYRKIEAGTTTETAQDSILDTGVVKTTAHGSKEVSSIFDRKMFDYAKPTALVCHFTKLVKDENAVIVDFFAGSGTTTHAVMQLNAEDGGNRKWICVQLPEKCKPETEAAKAGFVNIADIAKERIRRAGNKIKAENADKPLDTGFKVFRLDQSNFKVWDTQVDGVAQLEQQLLDFVDNVRPGARSEDLLYELILKTGKEPNVAIEAKEAAGGMYHRIGDGALIICLAEKLTEPLLAAMLEDKPEKIIVLDRAFANNDQLKTNMLLQAEHAGVKEFTVI